MNIYRMKIYLDDVRDAPPGWIQTTTADTTIQFLETGRVTHLSLDHDLGDDEGVGTGYDVLLWIEEQVFMHGFTPPKIWIHSANCAAWTKMEQAIEAIEKCVEMRKW